MTDFNSHFQPSLPVAEEGAFLEYLPEMYRDAFYPRSLVERIHLEMKLVADLLEEGERDPLLVQFRFDKMAIEINHLQPLFLEQQSALDYFAKEAIASTIERMIEHYELPINLSEALRYWEYASLERYSA